MARVAVCVPCWNKLSYTRAMVESVHRNSGGHQVFFIFVDNGSTDGTAEFLAAQPGVAKLIRNPTNVGVNPAWNELLKEALNHTPDVVCLANNDILVGPGWLDAVSAEIAKDDKRYFLPNGQFSNAATFDDDVRRALPGLSGTIPARAGWCMFFHPSAIPLFHPIPEEMKLWYGDDWMHHHLAKHGYRCESVRATCCLHHVSKTIAEYPGMAEQVTRDREAYVRLTEENATLDEVTDTVRELVGGQVEDTRADFLKTMTAGAPTTELYNRFLFLWVQKMAPGLIVETGTDRGRSGAHMAMGSDRSKVISVDIDPVCSAQLDALKLPNVETVTGDAVDASHRFPFHTIDMMFLDSLHEYDHMVREMGAYMSKLKPGALVFVDDIHLNSGMERLWSEVGRAKRDISALHFSGFGVFQV